MTDDANNKHLDDLVTRVPTRDTEALKELLQHCGGGIWSEISADIGNNFKSMVDADDVMQVTYMEAFLQMERLTARDVSGFNAWIRRMAKNNLKDAIKELQRKKRPNPALRVRAPDHDDSYVTLVEFLGNANSTPSRHVASDEASNAINALLDKLPPDYARVIRCYDLDGRQIADVAADLGRSPGAVHMLRARAHDRLRAMLGRETDFFTHTA
ncbi:MAG: RNA polymerase sigma factor [Planctomycetota bacterium]